MRYGLSILAISLFSVAAVSFSQFAWAGDDYKSTSENAAELNYCGTIINQVDELTKLANNAISDKLEIAQPAIDALRKEGREGLEKFVSVHREVIDQHNAAAKNSTPDSRWPRVKAALDSISGQYDCHASKLFWHTDFEQAKAAAQKTGKPILSLRLLGKLTDEFSCANSRFFRSTLYANQEVSEALRERFVLHWQTVRPVPRVTIDFGDGRKLERTLTGNSVHYILDSSGRIVDALPGLYGPKAFMRGLTNAETEFAAIKTMDDAQRTSHLQAYHDAQEKQILAAWQRDLAQLNLLPQTASQAAVAQAPRAAAANKLAGSKGAIESTILVGTLPDAGVLANTTDDAVWGRIAELHAADAELDPASVAFIKMQVPKAARAGGLAVSKMVVEDPMIKMVRNFQNTIGIDTVRNEYTLHRQFHEWFVKNEIPANVDVNQLNDRVYAQLFLTPSSDPWLGLMPGDVYTALDNNGVENNN